VKIIDYEDWIRRGPRMVQRAKFILSFFDRNQLTRKKKTAAKIRPSKKTASQHNSR